MSATRHNAAVSPFGRVVMAASLGGMDAFSAVLSGLPAEFPVPIVVVQHRRSSLDGSDTLVNVLKRRTPLPVQAAESGLSADLPGVTVIPGASVATIDSAGRWVLADAIGDKMVADALLMTSAVDVPTIAVILTGYLSDGSEGSRAVKRQGGRVLVQDPATARAAGMPSSVIATGCADFVLPLGRISVALQALTTAPGAADLLSVPIPPWASLTSKGA